MEDRLIEYKSTAAKSTQRDNIPEKVINDEITKTVAAFLNTDGGTLVIGVSNDLRVLGIGLDLEFKRLDLDGYINYLSTLLIRSLGGIGRAIPFTTIRVHNFEDVTVVTIDVDPSPRIVYAETSK
jgi:type I restriction enzyme R subunit